MGKGLNVTRRDFIKKTAVAAAVTAGAGSIVNIAGTSFAAKKAAPKAKPKIAKIIVKNVKTVNGKEVKWIDHPTKEEKSFIPTVRLPLIAQNGAFVPLTMKVKRSQTGKLYLKTFYVYDLNNQVPLAGSFHLTTGNGRAYISTRIKLLQESYVQVLAEYSNGEVYGSKKLVKVTVGGC